MQITTVPSRRRGPYLLRIRSCSVPVHSLCGRTNRASRRCAQRDGHRGHLSARASSPHRGLICVRSRIEANVSVVRAASVFSVLPNLLRHFSSLQLSRWKTTEIPDHLINHPVRYHADFVSETLGKELLELVKQVRHFPTNANDLVFANRTFESIGEEEARKSDGSCSNHFLIPNKDGTKCVLPGRFDVAYHFMKYGGVEGLKERYEVLASRMQSFGRYLFDLNEYPVMKEIFTSPRFLKDAVEICPSDKQVLDPFQYHLIIQVPGQTVPVHLDAPYFTDASRFQYPVWLLVAMTGSGIFQERFIDQVQVVLNLHEWNSTQRGGQFVHFSKNEIKPTHEQSAPRSATIVDGAKTMHATSLYQRKAKPPVLPKNAFNVIEYIGDDTWIVTSDDREIRKYKTNDLRITVVYRARCFESEEKRKLYNAWVMTAGKEEVEPVDTILHALRGELAHRRQVDRRTIDRLKPVKLAIELVEEFIKYPLPSKTIIPYNYCIMLKTHAHVRWFLRFFC